MFRSTFKRTRCIVPASGYYEWRAIEGGKQPYFISAASSGDITWQARAKVCGVTVVSWRFPRSAAGAWWGAVHPMPSRSRPTILAGQALP
ncbi:MAG: SOS response-associated peptidase family protein [Methylocella sp.]